MKSVIRYVGNEARRVRVRHRAFIKSAFFMLLVAPLIAGCASLKKGPDRPITLDEDTALLKPQVEADQVAFNTYPFLAQPSIRNRIITSRMYLIDIEYHKYEARLTKEMQEEGLAATLVSLGLTGSASVITVASTGRILSAVATAVTGADKAYNEKDLLSNTIQALQTQMRADRKTQAAAIRASMIKNGFPTPIDQYTLPMALSDVDHYYQSGTIASALIGLNKTLAKAEEKASDAKDSVGPNAPQVTRAKTIADPPSLTRSLIHSQIISNINAPFDTPPKPLISTDPHKVGKFERQTMTGKTIRQAQQALCVDPDGDLGSNIPGHLSNTRNALKAYLQSVDATTYPSQTVIDSDVWDVLMENLISAKKTACSS